MSSNEHPPEEPPLPEGFTPEVGERLRKFRQEYFSAQQAERRHQQEQRRLERLARRAEDMQDLPSPELARFLLCEGYGILHLRLGEDPNKAFDDRGICKLILSRDLDSRKITFGALSTEPLWYREDGAVTEVHFLVTSSEPSIPVIYTVTEQDQERPTILGLDLNETTLALPDNDEIRLAMRCYGEMLSRLSFTKPIDE
jgi:hypothetical protein